MKDKKDMYLWLQVDNDVTVPDIRSALSDKGITRCILHPLPEYDWQAFRREAAKDAMCAILSNSKMVDERSWDYVISVVKNAVGYADELIKQLQEDEK